MLTPPPQAKGASHPLTTPQRGGITRARRPAGREEAATSSASPHSGAGSPGGSTTQPRVPRLQLPACSRSRASPPRPRGRPGRALGPPRGGARRRGPPAPRGGERGSAPPAAPGGAVQRPVLSLSLPPAHGASGAAPCPPLAWLRGFELPARPPWMLQLQAAPAPRQVKLPSFSSSSPPNPSPARGARGTKRGRAPAAEGVSGF